jgi:hypothetical protein
MKDLQMVKILHALEVAPFPDIESLDRFTVEIDGRQI